MTDNTAEKAAWRKRVRNFYNIEKISQLSYIERWRLKQITRIYPFMANDYYLGLINWDDPDDPIRRLIIPHQRELINWGHLDASNENAVTVSKGLQHKYASTALLLVTQNCAGLCRYCFRKRLFIKERREAVKDVSDNLEYIRRHPEINNVLVTGGDPLVLPTRRLEKIISALRRIDHVRIIRIGSKIPAYNPFRIFEDSYLLDMISRYSLSDRRIYIMCHFDHPNELTPETRKAVQLLQRAGAICVNQNPIIRGISDSPEVMSKLWNELSYMGVPQYYVFQGRPTSGNETYEVPIVEAYFNIEEAKKKCSGLAKRTKYVMSHESGKIEIVGVDDRQIYLRYHRAMDARNENRFFICHRDDRAYWLDQLKPAEGHRNRYYQSDLTRHLNVNYGVNDLGEEGHV